MTPLITQNSLSGPGKAIIFSAPSGSGKTTLVKYLLENNNDLALSVSASTRTKRESLEKEGKDYYFFTVPEFKKKIENHEFIEWEQVYLDKFYGTLQAEVEKIWCCGKNVLFDVDVKGGINLKNYFQDRALSIFVKTPSLQILKERLLNRGTETPASLSVRLAKASSEMTFSDQFDIILLNDELSTSKKKVQQYYDTLKKIK